MKRCFKQAGQPHLWQTRFRPYETPVFFAGKRGAFYRLATPNTGWVVSFLNLFAYAFCLGDFPQISCKCLFFGPQKMLRHFLKKYGLQMVASLKWTSWSCKMVIFCKSIWFLVFGLKLHSLVFHKSSTARWSPQLSTMIPSFGTRLSEAGHLSETLRRRTAQALHL